MHETKIETKIQEEIKPLEEVCKKMMEQFASSIDNTDASAIPVAGQITDMIKDLAEAKEKIVKACYYKYILGQMEKSEEEDKEEEKIYLRMMKEEHKDELNRMREEYGEDEGERRFYDNYRYANGRFAPKGRGSYRPRSSGRRGYEEMMPIVDYMIPPEMYNPEWYRDMDRMAGKMYYSGGGNSGGSYGGNSGGSSYSGNSGDNSGGNSSGGSRGYSGGGSSSGGNGGSDGGSSRSYTEGYHDGEESGYQRGYSEGDRDGRRNNGGNSSRYDRARRGYEESKGRNGNSQEGNSENMRNLEKLLNIISEDVKEYAPEMSQSEKAMAKQKIEAMARGIQ